MLVKPLMPRLPGVRALASQPFAGMLAHQRVGIQLVLVVVVPWGKQADGAQLFQQVLPAPLI